MSLPVMMTLPSAYDIINQYPHLQNLFSTNSKGLLSDYKCDKRLCAHHDTIEVSQGTESLPASNAPDIYNGLAMHCGHCDTR